MEDIAKKAFARLFGHAPENVYSAPGRVNLIGEHTDYNDGFVLPTAIDFRTWVAACKRDDRIITAVALDEEDENGIPTVATFAIDDDLKKMDPPWSDYLLGVVNELKKEGYKLSGANLVIKSNVPRGAGLSSSAALENALVLALTDVSGEHLSGVKAALIGQAAENNFVGCNCGVMDQMVSALGKQDYALLLDCRSLEYKLVPMPESWSILIVNSNVKRGLVDSEYNVRRQQCEAAAKFFNVDALRDVSLAQLEKNKEALDPVVYRRALHIVTENQRTLNACTALEQGDLATLSRLMEDSHKSMKNDFEITVPAIDGLVKIIKDVIGTEGGVRMTGGGFGGCVVALIPKELEAEAIRRVEEEYPKISDGLAPSIFVCRASDGAFLRGK